MDLQEFVAETLTSIIQGVKRARHNHEEVAPLCHGDGGVKSGIIAPGNKPVFEISFDVAVTASDQNSQGAKTAIKVVSFFSASAEGKIENSTQSEVVSRVRFSVPIVLTPD